MKCQILCSLLFPSFISFSFSFFVLIFRFCVYFLFFFVFSICKCQNRAHTHTIFWENPPLHKNTSWRHNLWTDMRTNCHVSKWTCRKGKAIKKSLLSTARCARIFYKFRLLCRLCVVSCIPSGSEWVIYNGVFL